CARDDYGSGLGYW
nr:immunoglobulin heavy chain junction region [Macaca mulatta]MOV40343.1 immunoglobulin heavy chain junction region [Macaca mulatta]MOV42991.1 immunoglobulin heavy chain junction region [Macaca mulatta]MOV43285.1 immunoglobulin heavy chain junction region [Macaca mulatta]MOV46644.1 immunoglobulin heavy chain junction region [Macaca mulatta]